MYNSSQVPWHAVKIQYSDSGECQVLLRPDIGLELGGEAEDPPRIEMAFHTIDGWPDVTLELPPISEAECEDLIGTLQAVLETAREQARDRGYVAPQVDS